MLPKLAGTTTQAAATTTSTQAPTPAPPPSGPTYSKTAAFKANNFSFTIAANVTVGAATTNTEGMTPPFVNIVVPVTGTATLTNNTSGYTAKLENIPGVSLIAVYSENTVACKNVITTSQQTSRGTLCDIEVVGFAPGCNGNAPAIESLGENQSTSLDLWPNAPGVPNLATLNGGAAEACANTPELKPTPNMIISKVDSSAAQKFVAALSKPPTWWALVSNNEENCGENDVISSMPPGLTGCFGGIE